MFDLTDILAPQRHLTVFSIQGQVWRRGYNQNKSISKEVFVCWKALNGKTRTLKNARLIPGPVRWVKTCVLAFSVESFQENKKLLSTWDYSWMLVLSAQSRRHSNHSIPSQIGDCSRPCLLVHSPDAKSVAMGTCRCCELTADMALVFHCRTPHQPIQKRFCIKTKLNYIQRCKHFNGILCLTS